MKKYLTKRILLTLLALIGVFALFALLYGRYVIIEKDFFLDGEVAFVVRSYDGNSRVYATEEETALVKDWLTTLEKMSDTYEDGFVLLNGGQIRVKTDDSMVFFEDHGGEILVTADADFFGTGMDKWVRAKSSDPELTQRVFEICYAAVDNAESTLAPVWRE